MFSPPPPPHLFYIFFYPQKNRPHIDPILTLDSTFFFQHSFVNSKTQEPIWAPVKLYTTTTGGGGGGGGGKQ